MNSIMMTLILPLAAALFGVAVFFGLFWSSWQRKKAINEYYEGIKTEVHAERKSGKETMTVFSYRK